MHARTHLLTTLHQSPSGFNENAAEFTHRSWDIFATDSIHVRSVRACVRRVDAHILISVNRMYGGNVHQRAPPT